jgi:MYXO-CTERM domain-containing protein
MRLISLVTVLVSATALADVGPPAPKCVVPSECRACSGAIGDPDGGVAACHAQNADAGLVLSDCTDRSGAYLTEYYCPAGKLATRGCGCSSVEAMGAGLLGLVGLVLRRRGAPLR